ncbi:hypothetical protein EW026_g5467 [Hermanssonia centrifuga]|uniref:Aminoglycoside phosphotransferase domain-containing protein n=1 Tax=Hermanssonia centrifuga TaxID=98765 RepID=A0A4S4KDZ4_9APHY|nr:hypothetical protein EW026_g5467 [Hermanssonia centrifuga]
MTALKRPKSPPRITPKSGEASLDPLLKENTPSAKTTRIVRPVPRRPPGPSIPTTPIEIEIAQGEVLYSRTLRTIVKLGDGRVVKYGLCIRPEEAKVMKYIQSNTHIPLPGNVEYVSENGKSYLFMDHIDGEPLKVAWQHLQKHERANILNELKGYMEELRALRPDGPDGNKPSYIGSLDRGPCADRRVVGAYKCGPFDTEREFNDHIVANLRDRIPARQRQFLRGMMKEDHRICFTHGDLHPGWYPEYWDWCKTFWNEKWSMADWSDSRHLWLQPYEYEYAVDRLLISESPACW